MRDSPLTEGIDCDRSGFPMTAAPLVIVPVYSQSEEPPENVLVSSPPEEPPENMLVPPHPVESLVLVLVSPPPENSPENVLARSQPEESLKDVHVSAQSVAFLETMFLATFPGDRRTVLL